MNYPLYYIIKTAMAQQQLAEILSAVRAHKTYIEQIRDTKNEKSRKIELVLKPELKKLGFIHSATNKDYPLFVRGSQFEIDFYNPRTETAIEIERSNLYTKVWLALYKMLESNIIKHGLIFVPTRRIVRNYPEYSYELTCKRLRDNAHNLLHHLESLVVVGY
ncbi:MAG: hypothetical protein GX090_06035 [Firmicutes bacterium]|nr:hypothetical protein [Bacillota bacterium]HOB35132.1 hypothetical protein [Bacillota bacterium]HPZ90135.1 hypothetical protein [Bacillota bacterium]HQE01081.1 hypothetical protein [Bacillota bacterium]